VFLGAVVQLPRSRGARVLQREFRMLHQGIGVPAIIRVQGQTRTYRDLNFLLLDDKGAAKQCRGMRAHGGEQLIAVAGAGIGKHRERAAAKMCHTFASAKTTAQTVGNML
jgi:hypothetical protein